jgi:hypothetical protein
VRVGLHDTGRLRLGATVSMQVQSSASGDGASAWRVPMRAVFQWRNQPAVFVAAKDAVTLVPVTVLSADDDSAVVQGALPADGDKAARVVISGVAALKGALLGAQ